MKTVNVSRKIRIGVSLLLAATLGVALASCTSDNQDDSTTGQDATGVAVRLGPTNSYNALSVVRETGKLTEILNENGDSVDWKGPFAAFAPSLEAANADEIDGGSGGLTNYLTALSNGAEIVALGIEDISSSVGIVATEKSGAQSIGDLVGKRVAVNKGGTGEYLLLRALEEERIDADEVERVYLSPEDSSSAFLSDNVDAWATWDQYFATAQLVEGAQVLTTGKEIGNLNWTFQWVTKEFAETNPEQTREITRGLIEGNKQTDEDPSVISDLYRSYGASEEVISLISGWPRYTFYPIEEEQVEQIMELAEQLQRYGLISDVPDLEGAYLDWSQQ